MRVHEVICCRRSLLTGSSLPITGETALVSSIPRRRARGCWALCLACLRDVRSRFQSRGHILEYPAHYSSPSIPVLFGSTRRSILWMNCGLQARHRIGSLSQSTGVSRRAAGIRSVPLFPGGITDHVRGEVHLVTWSLGHGEFPPRENIVVDPTSRIDCVLNPRALHIHMIWIYVSCVC